MARRTTTSDAGEPAGRSPTTNDTVMLLALYLPQFHPIPENDEFWGPGFTEWTNTVAGTRRYSDHRQPRLPGQMGMYDLRLTETVIEQERLASGHGIDAFVYYHYWFEGRRVLGGPLDAKLADPSRSMPFALCWANHDWNRSQNGLPDRVLIRQQYSEQDDRAHASFIADAMADPRYLRWHDRPIFFMYRTQEHPQPARFADLVRAACAERGVDDPYLVRFETNNSHDVPPSLHHFDAGCDLHPHWLWYLPEALRPQRLSLGLPLDFWMHYDEVAAASCARGRPTWNRFPCVVPDWDTTARKPLGGSNSLRGATVHGYETWLSREVCAQRDRAEGPRMVVLNAWNEWSECGYLEPDADFGLALLEATARAKGVSPPLADHRTKEDDQKMYDLVTDPESEASAHRAILSLVPPSGSVVEIGCGSGHLTEQLQLRGNVVTAVDTQSAAAPRAARFAARAIAHDLDHQVLNERLRGEQFDCILLADVLAHVRSPQRVLTDALALLAPGGTVVISVPNVAHVDTRLMLLQGRWAYQPTGILDDTHLRFFTKASLDALLRDSGLVAIEWLRTVRPAFGTNLEVQPDEVATSMVEHLLADPEATTYQFVVRASVGQGSEGLVRPPEARHPIAGDAVTSREGELAALRAELEAYRNLKILRLTRAPRRLYATLRRHHRP